MFSVVERNLERWAAGSEGEESHESCRVMKGLGHHVKELQYF